MVEAQVTAIEAEDLIAYGATLDDGFVENELDKGEQIAAMQMILDKYDDLQVVDVDSGFYWYRGAPVYSAERVITGLADGSRRSLWRTISICSTSSATMASSANAVTSATRTRSTTSRNSN